MRAEIRRFSNPPCSALHVVAICGNRALTDWPTLAAPPLVAPGGTPLAEKFQRKSVAYQIGGVPLSNPLGVV